MPLLQGKADKVKDAALSQFPRNNGGVAYMEYTMRMDRNYYIE